MRHVPGIRLFAVAGILALAVGTDFVVRGFRRHPIPPTWQIPQADVERGRAAIKRHGCSACHVIPGIRGAKGRVGPQLAGFNEQIYIAGILPNTPRNLIDWIQRPQDLSPRSAMPNLGLTEDEARDIAQYIYTSNAP